MSGSDNEVDTIVLVHWVILVVNILPDWVVDNVSFLLYTGPGPQLCVSIRETPQ